MICRLPSRKLSELHKTLGLWELKSPCSKRELLSL